MMRKNNLDYFKDQFNKVGWFIPPYVSIGFLDQLAKKINDSENNYSQDQLETMLSLIYSPEHLASMSLYRYPTVPFVKDYSKTISEAIIAHFSCLDHVAVLGLMPVIEGVGISLAEEWEIEVSGKSAKNIFSDLVEATKKYVAEKNLGDVGQVISMLDSFRNYAREHLYINSNQYHFEDKTNRHGLLHGKFSDRDYGSPLNFYKAIAAINFLCFVASFKAPVSWWASDLTDESKKLAKYYYDCLVLSASNPDRNFKPKIDSRSLGLLFETQGTEFKNRKNV